MRYVLDLTYETGTEQVQAPRAGEKIGTEIREIVHQHRPPGTLSRGRSYWARSAVPVDDPFSVKQ